MPNDNGYSQGGGGLSAGTGGALGPLAPVGYNKLEDTGADIIITAAGGAAVGAAAYSFGQRVTGLPYVLAATAVQNRLAVWAPALGADIGSTPRRIAIIGDSRGETEFIAEGIRAGSSTNNAMVHWANCLSGHRSDVVAFRAVGGRTTQNVLDNIHADLDGVDFDYAVLICDVNDIYGGVSLAAMKAARQGIYDYLQGRGKGLIDLIGFPASAGNTGGWGATHTQKLLQLRQFILLSAKTWRGLIPVDLFSVFATASSSPATMPSAYSKDPTGAGVHLNGNAWRGGAALAEVFRTLFPPRPSLLASAADQYGVDGTQPNVNVIDNGLFLNNAGTLGTGASNAPSWATSTAYVLGHLALNGGNAYLALNAGTSGATAPTHTSGVASDGAVNWRWVGSGAVAGVATGWTFQRAAGAGTIYCATVDRADGVGRDQIGAIVGASSAGFFSCETGDIGGRLVSGATYVGEAEVTVLDQVGLNVPKLDFFHVVGGANYSSQSMYEDQTYPSLIPAGTTIHHKITPRTLPVGAVSGGNMAIKPIFAGDGQACIKIGRASLRRQ